MKHIEDKLSLVVGKQKEFLDFDEFVCNSISNVVYRKVVVGFWQNPMIRIQNINIKL